MTIQSEMDCLELGSKRMDTHSFYMVPCLKEIQKVIPTTSSGVSDFPETR